MRKLYTAVLFTLFCVVGFAQTPKFINYQGIARDATGAPISNTVIGLSFNILNGGTSVFTQTQTVNTNLLGLFSTQIGGAGLNIDWANGTYSLQVYMDAFNDGDFVALGTPQPLASVPYALHAASVPVSYSNNVLSIGSSTLSLPTPTINGAGLVSVISDTNIGANYTISVPAPTLSVNSNTLSISNGNSVTLLPETDITTSGIATFSTAGTNSFNISVPEPTLYLSGTSISISNGNTVTIPETALTATAGAGIATITSIGTNSFNIDISPQLSINNTSLSVSGGNTINLANSFPQTNVTASGIAIATSTISPGLNVFNVDVPIPAYNGTALTFGASSTTIAPTLSLNGTTLSAGVPSNSVNLASSNPWKIGTVAPVSILQSTAGLPVGIGGTAMTSASALLDVQGTNTVTTSILKAVNTNAGNTSAVLDVQTNGTGGFGMNINNTAASGDGAHFQTLNGYALHTQNTSATLPSFYARNNGTGEAGHFIGGFMAQGSTANNTAYAIRAQNSASSPLFAVRNDGAVSVGAFTVTPGVKLDVNGKLRMADGTEGAGKVLMSDISGTGTWTTLTDGWSLTGNAGTSTLNFLGTTDNQPLNFRVNNQRAAYIESAGLTFLGYQAGNANNGGAHNAAFGFQALQNNTSGSHNSAFGNFALRNTTTGNYNTGVGYNALQGAAGTTDANTAVGYYAMNGTTSGSNNTSLGYYSLNNNSTGSGNTAVGYQANVQSSNLTNATALGANAIVKGNNRVQLGNAADVEFDRALMPAGNAGAAGQLLMSNGAGAAPTWTNILPGVKHLDINATNVNLATTTSLGSLSMNLPGPGYVVVHFDGFAFVASGHRLLLAASNAVSWGANNGHSELENNTTSTETRSFSHTMYYTIGTGGTYTYYATGTLFSGTGVSSVYGHLTATYYPLQY